MPTESSAHRLSIVVEQQLAAAEAELTRRHQQLVRSISQCCVDSDMPILRRSSMANEPRLNSPPTVLRKRLEFTTEAWAVPSEEFNDPRSDIQKSNIWTCKSMHAISSPAAKRGSIVRQKSMNASALAKAELRNDKQNGNGNGQHSGRKAIFADPDQLKAQVKASLLKAEYDVTDYYHKDGVSQAICKSSIFEYMTLAVIAMNALWIAYDIDYNQAPTLYSSDAHFIFFENFFCVYFFAELSLRFMAFKKKRHCFYDAWFVFDSGLVMMMIFETWIMNSVVYTVGGDSTTNANDTSLLRIMRLLRLTRMARMVRLLRAMPELLILIKGIFFAAKSVFFTLVLLICLIYVFAIAFANLATDFPSKERLFPTVPGAMATLLLRATLPDVADLVFDVGQESVLLAAILLVFILLASLTVLNMLVGVLCEVVGVVSSVERERIMVKFVKSKLLDLLDKNDKDANQLMSRTEFEDLLLLPEGARIIQEVGVDAVGLIDFADNIFEEANEITFPEFMDFVLQLRGSNKTTVKDVVSLRKSITATMNTSVDNIVERLEQVIDVKLQRHMRAANAFNSHAFNSFLESEV